MQRTTLVLLAALTVALLWISPPAASAAEEGFVPLFDGKSLDGWKKAGGGATYQVEDGSIVGRVGPGSNTFLCTEKSYGDFVLKFEVKLDVPGNSGVQVRSHVREDKRGTETLQCVYGYQCEIDPSARAWSGGIYDESRRGWLFPLAGDENARKAFKLDGFNQFVIQCVGPSIKTWVNGVLCADLIDTADAEGFIALQVHAGKQGQIRWRNIRIKDLGQSKWVSLFNGKDLTGWEKIGGGQWNVQEGKVHGTSTAAVKEHGHLITAKEYGDFAVRVRYNAVKGNSGLYFRVEKGGAAGVKGFQAEIDPRNDAGGLYETNGRAWVAQPKPDDVKKWFKPGQWNEMAVVAVGRRLVVQVNGQTSAQLKDDPGRTQGFIALQLHGGQDMDVLFERVELMEIPPEKATLIAAPAAP